MLLECLLLNAVQAIPGGGQIDVSADESADGGVTVLVADSGGGLAPGTADRVFDPFFTTRESGLGLGLTLARQITAAHGGNIEIRDGSEAGTVVIVTLPQDHRRD
jgi:signal transduction histidine kinase